MKRYLVISGVVLVLAIGVVAALLFSSDSYSPWVCENGEWVSYHNGEVYIPIPDKECSATKQSVEQQTIEEPKAESAIVSSIKEAMGLGKAMRCTYTSTEQGGALQSSVVVDGQKFKTTSDMNGTKAHIVFDGTTQYIWVDGAMQGMKMTKACLDELKTNPLAVNGAAAPLAGQGLGNTEQGFETATNTTCSATTDEDFTLPSAVTFVDQCALMKQSLDAMKNFKPQTPSKTPSHKNAPLPKGMKVPPMPAAASR